MTLTELRQQFYDVSGRLDLDSADVDKFINRGVRFLDTLVKGSQKPKRIVQSIAPGTNTIVISSMCRVILDVYLRASDEQEKIIHLSPVSLAEMRDLYNNTSSDCQDSPLVYSPISLEIWNWAEVKNSDLAFFNQFGSFILKDPYEFNGLALYPVTTKNYTVEITGQFYSPTLTDTVSTNWWTERHEELVLQAALFKLDANYKNSSGQKALLDTLMIDVQEIIHDAIHEDSYHFTRMEG